MLGVYRTLLRLYPAEYRDAFGEEIISVLTEERNEEAGKNLVGRGRLFAREATGLLTGALREHLLALTEIHKEVSFATGRFVMRNGFRFPISTIVFMTLILACVMWAIQKGEDIATSVPNVNPPLLVHVQPVHSILLGGMPVFFGFFYAAGLIGWGILYALRRSGVHRLSDVSTAPK